MKKISPALKGFITSLAMIAVSIGIYYFKGNFENNLQYIAYFMYVAGIIWTLIDFKKHSAEVPGFKAFFGEGFKCFVVVALMMVAFTIIFLKLNPSFKEEMAAGYRMELTKSGNKTPAEINSIVDKSKAYFIPMLTSMAVFSYLAIGALLTLIGAGFLSRNRVQQNNYR